MKSIKLTRMFLFMLVLCLFSNFVIAEGVCSLDQDSYAAGETATFSCVCNKTAEQNEPGYIVWRNSSGTILQNTSTNSNKCKTITFGNSFIFPNPTTINNGSATFDTADAAWANVNDITTRNFTTVASTVLECLITDVIGSSNIILGEIASVKYTVVDASTMHPLIHMTCVADGYAADGSPLVFEPSHTEEHFKFTTSQGEVGFSHDMTEKFWKTNSQYIFEFHCFSLPFNSTTDHVAYDELTGDAVPLKACTAQAIFLTGSLDLREQENYSFIIISLIVAMIVFSIIGFVLGNFFEEKYKEGYAGLSMKIFGYGIALTEFIIIMFIVYANANYLYYLNIITINFYILLSLIFGIAMVSLVWLLIRLVSPEEKRNIER